MLSRLQWASDWNITFAVNGAILRATSSGVRTHIAIAEVGDKGHAFTRTSTHSILPCRTAIISGVSPSLSSAPTLALAARSISAISTWMHENLEHNTDREQSIWTIGTTEWEYKKKNKEFRHMNLTQTLGHVTLDIGKLFSDSEKVVVYEWGMTTWMREEIRGKVEGKSQGWNKACVFYVPFGALQDCRKQWPFQVLFHELKTWCLGLGHNWNEGHHHWCWICWNGRLLCNVWPGHNGSKGLGKVMA